MGFVSPFSAAVFFIDSPSALIVDAYLRFGLRPVYPGTKQGVLPPLLSLYPSSPPSPRTLKLGNLGAARPGLELSNHGSAIGSRPE